ncbi:acyl-CoA dehydrogenase [Mycolicibacterium elephantis]|uniref:Acyl-CoA dehydrogenase n=1 Tax=Mycolicibacterium elephantis TaxID=81858 RepID=A0A1X0CM07_9MYCO|nr:acyl-CoA dehydrogenase family protein [Mycolicibacterium elephantis]ORA61148.1 acyl-CoA dehydrogenase [Mycolicibacterium elephantis]
MHFSREHDLFRTSVREMLAKTALPHYEEWEEAGRFPAHKLFPEFAKLGLLGLEYDPAYGGEGADHWFTVIACEEFGRLPGNGIPMAYNVQANMATPSLHKHGSDELKREFLIPAIAGEQICSIAVTEPDAGSDVAAIRTKAVRDGADWLITGAKTYITNGVQGDWLCLLVRTSDEGGYRGMSQVVVPTDRPGLTVSRSLKKLGNWCSDTAELTFDRVRVPVRHTIGEVGRGFQQQMEQFQTERITAVYQAVGQMETAIDRTIDYLHERPAFGAKLIDNQYLQYNLAELACEVDALKRYAHSCAELIVAGADVTRRTSSAKLLAGKLIRRVADTCLQYHGGMGYMAETWTARFFRDSRLLSIGGGADEVMLRVLARDLISKQFFDDPDKSQKAGRP